MSTKVVELESSQLQIYPLDHLPSVNYDIHPAYGKLLPPASLRVRIRALRRWVGGLIKLSPQLGRCAAKRLLAIVKLNRYLAKPERDSVCQFYRDFERLGAVALRINSEEMERVVQGVGKFRNILQDRRSKIGAGKRKLRDNMLTIAPQEAPDLYEVVKEVLAKYQILYAASRYVGYQATNVGIVLQINEPDDISFWKNRFKDIPIPDAATTYMHIDSGFGVMKVMIYLSHVSETNGPFGYLLGSERPHTAE